MAILKSELIERLTSLCNDIEYDNSKTEYTDEELIDLLVEEKLMPIPWSVINKYLTSI